MKIIKIYLFICFVVQFSYAVLASANTRPWQKPQYSNQKNAIGYGTDAFPVPKGMDHQVQFWIDVYAKYSTDDCIIHDPDDMDTIYGVVNLKELNDLSGVAARKKEKMIQNRIDAEKKRIAEERNLKKEQANNLRCQMGLKDRMEKAIFLSGRYLPEMEEIFKEHGLPIELTRLVFVESSFNVFARSKVGASGLWQIMRYTARPYRMLSNAVDLRNDPIAATQFAAKMLRSNYTMLESWPLAITGYNHGPTGVRRLTQKYGTRDLGELVRNVQSSKTFGFASRNFYATFLAALEVEKNADKYFDKVKWSKPLAQKEIKLPVEVQYRQLKKWFNEDEEQTQLFNPHLNLVVRQNKTGIPKGTKIRVPEDQYDLALIEISKMNRNLASLEQPKKKRR